MAALPFWGIAVLLFYRPVHVFCPRCGIKQEALPWAEGKQTLTKPMIIILATWSKLLAIDVVASLFGVHWNTVYTAIRDTFAYGLAHRTASDVTYIGIDEMSRRSC